PPDFSRRQRLDRWFRLQASEFREFDALRGRRSSNARQRAPFRQHRRPGVNTRFKISLLFWRSERKTPKRAAIQRGTGRDAALKGCELMPALSERLALIVPRLLPNLAYSGFCGVPRGGRSRKCA